MTARCAVVIANAGSGKTWTLANRVLRWSLDEIRAGRRPEPACVLAVTFTRKAAGEILARVLSHAAQGAAAGATGARARADFEAVVGAATQEEYLAVLKALCSELHRLQVGTIDGFFHRIATALPEEVGLPLEWTLGDDRAIDALRAKAAAEMLGADDAEAFIALLERGEPKPSVTSAITALLGGSTFTPLDIYRATAAGGADDIARAWNWIDTVTVQPGSANDDFTAEAFDRLVEEAAASLPAALPQRNGRPPDARWQSALDAVIAALQARDFRALAASGFLAKMHRDESYYQQPMPQELHGFAQRLAPHLRKALLADIARQLRGALSVLPRASDALERLQREEGVFAFGDIGRGVARAASRAGSRVADTAALREILGADIRDLAIDEAQDTSVEQFLSLRPLLDEVLSGARGGRFLLVGDPKQSIYGWRGGTPGLIAHIERQYAAQLGEGVALTRSYRSSPLVMDFVNRVFGNLRDDVLHFVEDQHKADLVGLCDWARSRGLPSECTESAFKRALAAWPFARHESAKPTLPGWITATAYGKRTAGGPGNAASDAAGDAAGDGNGADGAADHEVSACACAAAIAARIHRESPTRTIGILVRKNAEITETIAALKALGVPASDEGRATLLDSPAVAHLVAMLRLVDDPTDGISHFLVSRGAMRSVTGLAPLESHVDADGRPDRAAATRASQRFAAEQRARIADSGLAAVLLDASRMLRAQGLASRDSARLARVVAIAEGFADRPPARLGEFIDAVAADKADASSSDRIRVMTVHKSKGLEFDEVVAVALDEGWGAAPTDWGMLVTSPNEAPKLVAPLANEAVRNWVPELSILERDERRRGLLDDLSTLYVALTRARQGLHLVMKAKPGGKLPTAAKLIVRALDRTIAEGLQDSFAGAEPIGPKLAAAEADSERPFWSHAFGTPAADAPLPPAAAATPAPGASGGSVQDATPPIAIVVRTSARASSPSAHRPASLWQFDPFANEDTALRGVLVHECFREVESAGASLSSSADRERLVARAARRAAVEKGVPIPPGLVAEATALLARTALGPLGRELRSGSGVRVHTELPFVRATADGLVHGRIDRLELLERDGEVTGAVIVDFKTGAVNSTPEALARKQRDYFEQLEGYAAAVSEMFVLDRSAITLKLLFVDRDEVAARGAG